MTTEITRATRRKRTLWKRVKTGQAEMAKYRDAERNAARKIKKMPREIVKK
jgi:hypothetical protein